MSTSLNAWLVENTRQIGTLESAVRTLTTFVPGQLQQIEVLSEASNAAIQGLAGWHDAAVVAFLREKRPELVTAHSKYIQRANQSPLYLGCAVSISTIRTTELLVEMIARQKRGESGRWKAILGIESAKVLLKLGALFSTGRPLAHSLVYEQTLSPDEIEALLKTQNQPVLEDELPRSKKTLPLATTASARLSESVLRAENILRPDQLLKPITRLSLVAELLTIFRPLIYALCAYRYRRQKTWKPWVIGILIEFLGRQLTEKVMALRGLRHSTSLERDQLQHKSASLKWWALRGEFYNRVTRPVIAGVANKLDKVPVLSLVGLLISDSLYLWDDFYFSSSNA